MLSVVFAADRSVLLGGSEPVVVFFFFCFLFFVFIFRYFKTLNVFSYFIFKVKALKGLAHPDILLHIWFIVLFSFPSVPQIFIKWMDIHVMVFR